MNEPSRGALVVSRVCQLIAAGILAQTLAFKFTASPESVAIFTKLGMEPWGRIGSGVGELIGVLLLLWPRTAVYGSKLTLGILAGAIVSHLTVLGIAVQGDHGLLFGLALTAFACAGVVVFIRWSQIPLPHRPVRRRCGSACEPPTRA
jgi:hypothetical protein